MAAGTQGFTDTRKDTNHIGVVISKILEARKLADEERKYAESIAEKRQTSLAEAGIEKGYFFKKALRWKFGGEIKQKKLAQINTWKTRGNLLKSAVTGKSGKNKLDKFERSQMIFEMFESKDKPKTFRDKFKTAYEGFVDDPLLRPQSKWVAPGTAKKIKNAISPSKEKKRVSKEDILETLSRITESIEQVAKSISEKNKVVSDQMIHSSVLQGMMYQELKNNSNSLEEKLQKIINAISNQTNVHEKVIEKAKQRDAETKLEAQKDVANIVSFDDLTTKEDESKISQFDAYSQRDMWRDEMLQNKEIPKAEQGGIFSGPDSGYKVELHGNEAVVPLDNNYTQGEPSAVDGKVRPKPMYEMGTKNIMKNNIFNTTQKYENGTTATAPITSKFGFNTIEKQMGIAKGGTSQISNLSQSMVDVMSLPMIAAGGTILSATTKYMQNIAGEGADIAPEIEQLSRPIADSFGLPPSIVNKAKQKSSTKLQNGKDSEDETGESKKNIIDKMKEGFAKLLENLGKGINNPPPRPGVTGPGVDFSGNKPSVEIPVQQNVMNQFESTENWSTYRETIASKESGGEYNTRGGAGGNYEGRYQINHEYLDDIARGLGEATPTREQFRKDPQMQERFMQYYTMDNRRILEAYSPKFKKMSKKEQMAILAYAHSQGAGAAADWVESGMGAGTADQFGTKGRWYYENVAANLEKISSPQPTTQPKPAQLGQAITNNYGLKVGEERTFTHPQYGEIKARKTTTGFDFYGPGLNNKLDISPNKPQGKSIVDYFTSTNGGQQISPPQQQKQDEISYMSRPPEKSSGGGVTVLNTSSEQQLASAGSSPQRSGSDGTESGVSPSKDFYPNLFSISV